MHDVLAHRISQISMRAGALSYRDDLSNDELREGAAVIREAAHEALTDLRGVLGVLRDESGELQHAPQPTYADLGELVAEAQRSGMRVTYVDDLPAGEPIPDAAGRTLYRIVQEGITNARKHAPGAELEIEVHGSPDRRHRRDPQQPVRLRPDRDTRVGPGPGRPGRTGPPARRSARAPARK